MNILEKLRKERTTLIGEIEALMSAEDFDPQDKTLVEARSKADALDTKIKSIVEFEQSRAAANEVDAMSLRARTTASAGTADEVEYRSIGEAYVRSRAYADYLQSPRGTSGRVTVDANTMFRAPITSTTFNLTDAVRIPDRRDAEPRLPLLDVIPRIPVAGNSVEWVIYPPAPEAGVVTEGSVKPEAVLAPELTTASLEIVAHYVQYTRNVLEDDAALMAYINSSLRQGVLKKIASQAAAVLNAETGFLDGTYPSGGTLLGGIRSAIGLVQTQGYDPDVVVLNPADYADLDISLLGQSVVNTGTGPQIGGTYWGVRPIPAAAVPVGTAYVGDFSTAMALLMRSEVAVYTTDSHASTFTSNVLTTLAETRAKAIVHQPNAVAKVKKALVAATK